MFFPTSLGPSPIETLLDKLEGKGEDADASSVTLREFLDEDDLLPELRADNKRLIDYLVRDEVLPELVDWSTQEVDVPADASAETRAKLEFKYPHIAAEILSAELTKITDAVLNDGQLIGRILDLLDKSGTLSPVQSVNFAQILVSFLRIRNTETLQVIYGRQKFVLGLLRNLYAAPIADLIVRILDNPESERPFSMMVEPPSAEALRLLTEGDVLVGLGQVFTSTVEAGASVSAEDERLSYEKIENVANTIIGMTRKVLQLEQAHFSVPENLNIFKNPETLGTLIDVALNGDRENVVVRVGLSQALNIAIDLLTTELNWCSATRPKNEEEKNDMHSMMRAMSSPGRRPQHANSVGSSPLTSPKSTGSTHREALMSTYLLERELQRRLGRLLKELESRSVFGRVETTTGVVEEPLGVLRMKLIEFFVACLKSGSEDLQENLFTYDVPPLLLDLFFHYEWNSILHNIIASSIVHALDESNDQFIQKRWLGTRLVQKLMSTYRNYKEEKQRKELYRNGLIGHVVMLCMKVEEFLNNYDYRANRIEFLREDVLDEFETFCQQSLAEEKQRINAPLGGEVPENSIAALSDNENSREEATEVFDMEDSLEELSAVENNDAMKQFAAYLFRRSDDGNLDSEDETGGIGGNTGTYDSSDEDAKETTAVDNTPSSDSDDSNEEDYEQFVSAEMDGGKEANGEHDANDNVTDEARPGQAVEEAADV